MILTSGDSGSDKSACLSVASRVVRKSSLDLGETWQLSVGSGKCGTQGIEETGNKTHSIKQNQYH